VVEGQPSGGMIMDFADLKNRTREVLHEYDHRNWNDFLDFPSVENICALLSQRLRDRIPFSLVIRVYEGQDKWAEM
jgi:6-pyruvoyltetrahydropterin/6-carboxytetrahydropterin synthase